MKKLINEEAEVDIPEKTIDTAYCVGPKKNKNQAIIVTFFTFRRCKFFIEPKRNSKLV